MNFENLIIGVNIDDTITDTRKEIELVSNYFGVDYANMDKFGYSLSKNLGITQEEEDLFWKQNIEKLIVDNYLADYYLDFEEKILSKASEIIYVTNREKEYYEQTKYWLQKNNVYFDKLYLMDGKSKIPVINKHNMSAFVDDKASLFDEMISNNLKCQRIVMSRDWNNHLTFPKINVRLIPNDNKLDILTYG